MWHVSSHSGVATLRTCYLLTYFLGCSWLPGKTHIQESIGADFLWGQCRLPPLSPPFSLPLLSSQSSWGYVPTSAISSPGVIVEVICLIVEFLTFKTILLAKHHMFTLYFMDCIWYLHLGWARFQEAKLGSFCCCKNRQIKRLYGHCCMGCCGDHPNEVSANASD